MTKPNRTPVLPGRACPAPRTDGDFRDAMAMFPTGVTVVTTGGEHIHGMTANSFTSVSLDPPLVLVCVARTARMHPAILATGSFAVSILSGEQERVARYFAESSRPNGAAQFDDAWETGAYTAAPLLAAAAAWMECAVAAVHDGGDHSVVIGEVLGAGLGTTRGTARGGSGGDPCGAALAFCGRRFHRLAWTEEAAE